MSVEGILMVWDKGVGTMLHHEGGKVVHVRLVLNMHVSEHLVTVLETDKYYDAIINEVT